jgi:hypothetical protein
MGFVFSGSRARLTVAAPTFVVEVASVAEDMASVATATSARIARNCMLIKGGVGWDAGECVGVGEIGNAKPSARELSGQAYPQPNAGNFLNLGQVAPVSEAAVDTDIHAEPTQISESNHITPSEYFHRTHTPPRHPGDHHSRTTHD